MKKSNLSLRLSACLACLVLGLYASAGVKYLLVNCQDGTTVTFCLADDPAISVKDNELVVKTASESISVPFQNLLNYTFSDINGIQTEVIRDASYEISSNAIFFNNLTPSCRICIYTLDGKLAKETAADSNGSVSTDITSLPSGVYLVTFGGNSFKFRKH